MGSCIPLNQPEGQECTWGQLVAMAMYTKAAAGDTMAAKLVLDRVEPCVTVTADITERLTRDEQIEQIAQHTSEAINRWAREDAGSPAG